ncbi:hypothetical protein APY03_0408 [Variovorax sp. WDL1]|nr:hypothetical protein APY03_0408 [Variovorax sp. WDL1]
MSSSYSWMQTFIACSLGFGSLLVWSSLSLLFRAVGLMDFGFSEAAELATDEGLVWMAGALLGVLFAQFLIGFAAISALERALD